MSAVEYHPVMVLHSNQKTYEMKETRISPSNVDEKSKCEITEININNNDSEVGAANGLCLNSPEHSISLATNKRTGILRYLNSTFDTPALERIYQNYFLKRRRKSLLFLLLSVAVFNITLSIFSGIEYNKTTRSHLLYRLCVSVISIVLSLVAFILYSFKIISSENFRYLPAYLWIIVYLQLLVDLLLGFKPNLSSDLVGLYIFFIYVTYAMITFRLYACVIVALITSVTHATAVCASLDTLNKDNIFQVVGNVLLFFGANVLGIINYLVVDVNQRRSFLDTREAIQVKLSFEKEEKNQSRLLQSILPPTLANEVIEDMKVDGSVLSGENAGFKKIYIQSYNKCSILFADIVGFTEYSSGVTAEELIIMLNELFANFDKFANRYYCQRIKILGDCYYCISGIDIDGNAKLSEKHAENSVEMGLTMVEHIQKVREEIKVSCLDMRVGIHSGHVLAGILGQRKWQFDVWSNDVTLANKMESAGIPGRVHISGDTYDYVKGNYEFEEGGGADRNQFLKDNHIKTYLVKPKVKTAEDEKTASMKTLVNNIMQRKRKETNSTTTSKFAKISNAFSSTKKNHHQEEKNEEEILTAEEVTIANNTDIEIDSGASTEEDRINNMLQDALNHRNSELKDVANLITMKFKDNNDEAEYHREKKIFCLVSLIGPAVLTLFSLFIKLAIGISKTTTYIIFAASFSVVFIIWFITWIGRFSKVVPSPIVTVSSIFHYYGPVRDIVTLLCVFVAIAAEVCDIILPSVYSEIEYSMYYSYIGILILFVTSNLIQLSYLLRIVMLLITTVVFSLVNFLLVHDNYKQFDIRYRSWAELRTSIILSVEFIFFFVILLFHSRLSEGTSRVLMLWKKEALDNKSGIESLRHRNERLMKNILPVHVIDHFLKMEHDDETELYSRSYQNVGVIFASIPNFSSFYSEEGHNKGGIECMRVLNEIISDFDDVLSDPRFQLIEKIKTVNSCYMAASGLREVSNSPDIINSDPWQHLVDLTDFALKLKEKLDEMNAESFNNFELRVGIANGPVVAGVIGAKKPHYDIWGNTVNISSRMESTGRSGSIQVLENTYAILKERGFQFEKRGYVNVKGKGQLLTYWCIGRNK